MSLQEGDGIFTTGGIQMGTLDLLLGHTVSIQMGTLDLVSGHTVSIQMGTLDLLSVRHHSVRSGSRATSGHVCGKRSSHSTSARSSHTGFLSQPRG